MPRPAKVGIPAFYGPILKQRENSPRLAQKTGREPGAPAIGHLRKFVKMLVDKRVLVPAGERRGPYYQASPELLEIGKKIFQPFKMDDEPFKSKPQQGVLPGIE